MPALVHTHPNETIAEAVHILQEYGVSQMPVVRAEPPVMAAEVAGSVSERELLDALFSGKARLADPVEAHMDAPLPTLGATAPSARPWRRWRTPTPCSCRRTASRSASSPGRTCSPTSPRPESPRRTPPTDLPEIGSPPGLSGPV